MKNNIQYFLYDILKRIKKPLTVKNIIFSIITVIILATFKDKFSILISDTEYSNLLQLLVSISNIIIIKITIIILHTILELILERFNLISMSNVNLIDYI